MIIGTGHNRDRGKSLQRVIMDSRSMHRELMVSKVNEVTTEGFLTLQAR